MYFGAQEPRAEMPTSSKWIVVCFAAWRLAADVLLTSANYFSGKFCLYFGNFNTKLKFRNSVNVAINRILYIMTVALIGLHLCTRS